MTNQESASPVTVSSHNSHTPANSQTPLKHGVIKRNRVAKLIGKRCMLACYLSGVKTDMLLDHTGKGLARKTLTRDLSAVTRRPPAR